MAVPEGVEYRCFVGGLAWATAERDLEAAFRPFGEILDAKIINDRETGRSRGFGFVTFSSEQSMRAAIQGMNGKVLGGRSITVNEARPRQSGGRGHEGGQRHEPGDGGSAQRRNGNSDRRVPRFASGMNHPKADDILPPLFGGINLSGRVPSSAFGMNHTTADDILPPLFGGINFSLGRRFSGMNTFGEFGELFGGINLGGRGRFSGMNTFGEFGEFPFLHFPGEASMHASQRPQKAPAVEYQLVCNLADLYKGATKKMKISRELLDSSGRSMVVQEILTIDIKPGWKKGTKITFAEKGNEAPHVIPADIVFIIDEKAHDQFTREGNDLVMTQKVSLAEDWARYTVHVTTLDGRNLAIPIKSVVKPGYEEIVPGEGMPVPKDPCKKGNLRIKFNINFPSGAEN